MDIVRIEGGLGNQMFQYAFAESLRRLQDREVKFDLSSFGQEGTRKFRLKQVFPLVEIDRADDSVYKEAARRWLAIASDKEAFDQYEEDVENKFFYVSIEQKRWGYEEDVYKTKDCIFTGFWQTEKYFAEIRDVIRRKFSFRVTDSNLVDFGEELSDHFYSVHVRRGDYCLLPERFCGICTPEYYKKAISYIKERDSRAKFIFFSDDMDYIRGGLIPENDKYIFFDSNRFETYQDWYDMYLMTKCCGNIIANSTFSWWGAWLNPKGTVVAPSRWFGDIETPDIWCDGWVKL